MAMEAFTLATEAESLASEKNFPAARTDVGDADDTSA